MALFLFRLPPLHQQFTKGCPKERGGGASYAMPVAKNIKTLSLYLI